MREVNPEHALAVKRLVNEAPYYSLLSMNFLQVGYGYSLFEIDLAKKHTNPLGIPHGGVYSSVIDTAAYWASYFCASEEMGMITIDLHVDNISAAGSGIITAEGKLIKPGRTICISECMVRDSEGRLLAHGTSKQLVTNAVSSIRRAVSDMGKGELPPKFLTGER